MNVGDVKRIARRALQPAVVAIRPTRHDLDPGIWGLHVDDGTLRHGLLSLPVLAEEFGSPLHVDDLDRLTQHVSSAVTALEPGLVYARHQEVDTSATLATLGHAGAGVSVASSDELHAALSCGIAPDRLVVVEACPSDRSLVDAVTARPRAIVVSTAAVAQRLVSAAADHSGVDVGVEIRLDDPAPAREAMRVFADASVNVAVLRVRSSEVVRTTDDVETIVEAVAGAVKNLVPDLPQGMLEIVLSIDVACPTTAPIPMVAGRLNRAFGSDLVPPDLDATVSLDAACRQFVRGLLAQGVSAVVSMEPGPALLSSSQFLLTTVLDVKADGDVTHVVLDAGINIAEATTTEFHQLFNASQMDGEANDSFRLVGPICTPADVLYTNWRLSRAAVGDVLAIMDTGSGFVNSSTMFSFPRPAIVQLVDGEAKLSRRGETFEDLVARDTPIVRRA